MTKNGRVVVECVNLFGKESGGSNLAVTIIGLLVRWCLRWGRHLTIANLCISSADLYVSICVPHNRKWFTVICVNSKQVRNK